MLYFMQSTGGFDMFIRAYAASYCNLFLVLIVLVVLVLVLVVLFVDLYLLYAHGSPV